MIPARAGVEGSVTVDAIETAVQERVQRIALGAVAIATATGTVMGEILAEAGIEMTRRARLDRVMTGTPSLAAMLAHPTGMKSADLIASDLAATMPAPGVTQGMTPTGAVIARGRAAVMKRKTARLAAGRRLTR